MMDGAEVEKGYWFGTGFLYLRFDLPAACGIGQEVSTCLSGWVDHRQSGLEKM